MTRSILAFLTLMLATSHIFAQTNTVGLIEKKSEAWEGYTLFAPTGTTSTYLIDINGLLVREWTHSTVPGQSVYLLKTGDILRTAKPFGQTIFKAGGTGGRVERISWEGDLEWGFTYRSSTVCHHHDVEPLPNGNVLLIAWELKSSSEAIAVGRYPQKTPQDGLWPDHIIEVQPDGASGGTIVWEWHAWDHLVQDFDVAKPNYGNPSEHPERIDINAGPRNVMTDWLHTNSVKYNAELDQIILSVHNFSEIWVIDHSTTTEEAAGSTGGSYGKGGDLLYRWGNPEMYGRGSIADKKLFGQHDAQWISSGLFGEGNILIYNNGLNRPDGEYSTVEEIIPPVEPDGTYRSVAGEAFGPDSPTWQYIARTAVDFFSQNISGVQRLPNSNTLVCEGASGEFFEVNLYRNVVWRYINPAARDRIISQGQVALSGENQVFKVRRYAADYPGLLGKDLTPGGPIEGLGTGIEEEPSASVGEFYMSNAWPNPFTSSLSLSLAGSAGAVVTVRVCDVRGAVVTTLLENASIAEGRTVAWNSAAPPGVYRIVAYTARGTAVQVVVKQ